MWVVRAVLVLLLLLSVVAFVSYNNGPDQRVIVHLQPLFSADYNVPLTVVVFWSLVAGAILSALLFVSMYLKLSMQAHSSQKRIRALEGEVTMLRNRPIEESADLLKGADRKKDERESPFTGK